MRGRPAPPAIPGSALGCDDRPLLQASLPRVARGRPGRRLGGEMAQRRAWQDHRVLPAGSSVLGRGQAGRQAGRTPAVVPVGSGVWGACLCGPGVTDQGANKQNPSNMRREVSHTVEAFVKLELLANGHLKFRRDLMG